MLNKAETDWRINFKYVQNINSEFEFEDIINLSSIYSKFILWIYKPMPAVSKLWLYLYHAEPVYHHYEPAIPSSPPPLSNDSNSANV